MTTLRRILALAAVTAMGVALGAAASLTLTAASLGAATTSTPRCTATGLSVLNNLTAATVSSVVVGVLPAGCAGATLQVTVNNGVTNSSGSAVVPGGGGSVTVTLAVPVALTATEQTDLTLVGP